jgi:exosortase O
MVHLPLGVLGFIGSCAAALVLIRRLPEWPPAGTIPESAGENYLTARPAWLSPLLTIILLSMALAYKSNTVKAEDNLEPAPLWNFDSNFQTQPAPLSAQEEEWIHQAGAQTADRYTFQWIESGQAQSSGVVMLLTSQTWRGQHRPERCFEVFGFTIQESATILAGPDFSLRGLSLTGPDNPEPVSAVYWLQSAEMTTGDFGQRIWADLQPRRERWVLVTILFDRQVDLHSPDLIQLLDTLRESVGRSLVEGGVG